jgi:hypothetical protein
VALASERGWVMRPLEAALAAELHDRPWLRLVGEDAHVTSGQDAALG